MTETSKDKHQSDVLKMIFSPTFLVIGLIGNAISIIIFNQRSMKKYTTFRYLTLLSVIDICALYIGFSHIMFDVYFNIDVRLINEASCKIQSFLVYFFTHFSSALLAVMSIDRTVSITFKMKKFSTPATALRNFVLIGIFMFFVDLHFLLFTHLYELDVPSPRNQNASRTNDIDFLNVNSSCNLPVFLTQSKNMEENMVSSLNKCSNAFDSFDGASRPDDQLTIKICYARLNTLYFHYLANYFPWIDLFFYAILPFIIMVVCTLIIIINIMRSTKNFTNLRLAKTRLARNKQLFFILTTTNGLFICLVSPLVLLNALGMIEEGTRLTTIAYILAYANHGLNFVFYGITCENYRRELIKIFEFSLGKSKPNVQTSTIHLNYLPTRVKTETRVEIKGYYTFLTSANKKKKEQVV